MDAADDRSVTESNAPPGCPHASGGAMGYGGGLLSAALLPPVVHEASAAILLVDLHVGHVVYVNDLARSLAPDITLPVAVDEWSEAAGLEDAGGVDLPADGARHDSWNGGRPRSESLLRVAHGEPVLGEAVSAARLTEASDRREPLWVIGLPMAGAPEPVSHLALVAFMPMRQSSLIAGAQESAALLRDRAVLATRVSFTITDPQRSDNPLVWVNPAFTATTGYEFAEVVGRNCRFLQGPETDDRVVREIRDALARRLPITTTLLNYRKDGTAFWNELSISPIFDAAGRVTHFVGVQADVTGRIEAQQARDHALAQAERAAGRLGVLADFAKQLSDSLEIDDIVALLAAVTVPNLGTWCSVNVLDQDGRLHSVLRHEREDDPEIAAVLAELSRVVDRDRPAEVPSWHLLRGDMPYILDADRPATATWRSAGWSDDARTELAERLGVESFLIVPIGARDHIFGALAIAADKSRRPFDEDDLRMARELATRAGLMLENSKLYALQRSASVTLQRSLLPQVPAVPGLSIAAEYVTATDQAAVGGDWYDVFTARDGAVGIVVGDAMGHNFDSAGAMGKLSTMVRAYAWPGASPVDVLSSVDELLVGTQQQFLATCVYGCLRLTERGGEFGFASAGHPPPILRRPDGTAVTLAGGHGPMLGVSRLLAPGAQRREQRLRLEPGSTLLFFTDGLIDSVGPELDVDAAISRLAEIVAEQPADATPAQLVQTLVEQQAEGRRVDDVVVVAVHLD